MEILILTDVASSKKNRLFELDFLKVMAIVLIVFSHFTYLALYTYSIGTFFGDIEDILKGTLGVIGNGIFFFISGYTLFLFNQKFSSKQDYISFFRKRILRIYPLYWIGIFAFVFLNYLLNFYNRSYSVFDVIVHLSGIQIIFFPKYVNEISVFWFVSAILIYYIIYSILISISKNSRDILLYGSMIFLVLVGIRFSSGLIEGKFFEYYFVFLVGVICAKEQFFNCKEFKNFGKYLIIPIICCFLAIIFLKPKMYDSLQSITINLLLNVGFIILLRIFLIFICVFYIYCLVSNSSWKEKTNIRNFFENCSLSAFPIYLFHIPFFVSLNYCLINLLGIMGIFHDIIIIFAGWPLLYVFAYYIQYFFLKFLRNFFCIL